MSWYTHDFVVHSMESHKALVYTLPGVVDEPKTMDLTVWRGGLESTVREAVRRRCKHGDFPITFQVRLDEGVDGTTLDLSKVSDNRWGYPAPPPFQTLDFRNITREPHRVRCTITVDLGYIYRRKTWIIAGAVEISQNQDRGLATIKARLPYGVTDFEGDSCYAFNFDVIGLRYSMTTGGTSWFNAYLHPNPEYFSVPNGDYNPMEHPDAKRDGSNIVLPEGFFTPTTSEEGRKLFRMLQGRELTIRIGPDPVGEDEEE